VALGSGSVDRILPASLFSAHTSGVTLATGSDSIYYYGEIYQSEGPVTTTDMGSGEFAEKGFGRSAYIHNMVYFDSTGTHDYTAGFWDSDPTKWDHRNVVSSGTNWVVTCILVGLALVGKWLDKFIEALRNQMKVDSFFFMWEIDGGTNGTQCVLVPLNSCRVVELSALVDLQLCFWHASLTLLRSHLCLLHFSVL